MGKVWGMGNLVALASGTGLLLNEKQNQGDSDIWVECEGGKGAKSHCTRRGSHHGNPQSGLLNSGTCSFPENPKHPPVHFSEPMKPFRFRYLKVFVVHF